MFNTMKRFQSSINIFSTMGHFCPVSLNFQLKKQFDILCDHSLPLSNGVAPIILSSSFPHIPPAIFYVQTLFAVVRLQGDPSATKVAHDVSINVWRSIPTTESSGTQLGTDLLQQKRGWFLYFLLLLPIRYDMKCHFNMRSKAGMSQLNLLHDTTNWKMENRKK